LSVLKDFEVKCTITVMKKTGKESPLPEMQACLTKLNSAADDTKGI